MADEDHDGWSGLATLLATMPDLLDRLTAAHITDPAGRCRACTTAGRGTPGARWPCALAVLADDARRIGEHLATLPQRGSPEQNRR